MGREMGGRFKREGYMHTYGWFILRFDRKQQNSVKQLSFNKSKKKKKRSCSSNAGMQEAQVQSLVGKIRSYMLSVSAKKMFLLIKQHVYFCTWMDKTYFCIFGWYTMWQKLSFTCTVEIFPGGRQREDFASFVSSRIFCWYAPVQLASDGKYLFWLAGAWGQ